MFGFFKMYKPKTYGYRPIYYDPKKEAMKERLKNAEAEKNATEGASGEYIPSIQRGTFRSLAEQHKKSRTAEIKKSNVRLIVIMVLLLLLMYFIIN